MFETYFKLAYRNIVRDKAYSILNVAGLAIGLASSILILLWAQNELSYDKFHTNANQVYRIACNFGDSKTVGAPAGMPAGLMAEIPAIKNTIRMQPTNTTLLEAGNKRFEEEGVFYADESFMDVFSYPLLKGDRATAMKQVDGILITQKMAGKYFGNDEPMGKTIRINNTEDKVVTGVLTNIPANSDLQFDFILPMAALARTNDDLKRSAWNNFNFYDYLLLDKSFEASPANMAKLQGQIGQIFKKHDSMKASFELQPLTSIHLAPELQGDMPGHGNALYVRIFFIIAVLILVVASINFMNLATARSARRSKEIGLRKVSGANRGQLVVQFLGESVFISFIALGLALIVVYLFLPAFNQLANRQLTINPADVKLWLSLIGIALLTGLLSGSYPALFLSGFNPVKVLKGNVKSMGGNLWFRNGLVVVQSLVTIVLLVGTTTIYNQLKFIRERNPGYEKGNLLYVPMTGDIWSKQQAYKNELKRNPLTSDFTIATDLPISLGGWTVSVEWDGKDARSQTAIPVMAVDETFTRTFKIKMLTGRSFSSAFKTDSSAYMVNQKMLSLMGLKPNNAIGKSLTLWGNKGTIIGVVKDFNFKPVQQVIEPLIMPFNKIGGYTIVRTQPGKTNATIKALATINEQLNPAHPFKFDFLDQQISNLYKGEQQMGKIFNLFAGLAIFISCLGLYGLSAFMAEQRTKEIGVRKVLGASVVKLVYLLSSGVARLILIAISIGIPLSWYAVNKWLEGFAYHINVSWLIFLIASLASLFISLITVSYESVKAAIVNPIKSLRAE